jgi:quercetin dioxygenase-like cupin family protein
VKKWSARDLLGVTPDGRFRRMECQEARLRAGTLAYAAGDTVGLHAHMRSDEIFFVVSGSAQFTVDGEEVEMQEGDMLHAGAGERHAIAAGPDGLVLFVVVAPNLDDAWMHE